MLDKDKGYYVERERQYNREQNQAELERLRDLAFDMQRELKEGKLSEAARRDLASQLSDTNQAIKILRDSLYALSQHDVVMVEEVDTPISVEITDQKEYWSNEYFRKYDELTELQEEYSSYIGVERSETVRAKIAILEKDMEKVERELEIAFENFEKTKLEK
jgi:hypothetical protein